MANNWQGLPPREASALAKLPYFNKDSAVPGKLAKFENVTQFIPGTVTADTAQYR
jgi:hypothetical protein